MDNLNPHNWWNFFYQITGMKNKKSSRRAWPIVFVMGTFSYLLKRSVLQSTSQDIFPMHTKMSWKATKRHHMGVHLCDKVSIIICMWSVALLTDLRTIWHTGTPQKRSTHDSLPRFRLTTRRPWVLQIYRLYTKGEKPNVMSYFLPWKNQHINCTISYPKNKINQIYIISENMNLLKQRQRD